MDAALAAANFVRFDNSVVTDAGLISASLGTATSPALLLPPGWLLLCAFAFAVGAAFCVLLRLVSNTCGFCSCGQTDYSLDFPTLSSVELLEQGSMDEASKGGPGRAKRGGSHQESECKFRARLEKIATADGWPCGRSASASDGEGTQGWHPQLDEDEPWQVSAQRFSKLLTSGYLALDEVLGNGMRDFFAAHRVLAESLCGSLGIRLTVQFNLFAGTVLATGSPEQIAALGAAHEQGEAGCFLLTERGAGVVSGLVVETIATWTPEGFKLHSPGPDSEKVWISQGLAARWGVVIARLIDASGKDQGPQGFLLDMTTCGVSRKDMGAKTSFNSLDNACVSFDNVMMPHSTLLSRYGDTRPDGTFHAKGNHGAPTFQIVAQRLLSGRICISDAAITYFSTVLRDCEAYAGRRLVYVSQDQQTTLRSLPYMAATFDRLHAGLTVHRHFIQWLQDEFAVRLDTALEHGNDKESRELINLIAASKVEAVEFAINAVHLLRRNVGSYGLMQDSPFGSRNEILFCCRFAEGDSRVLQQMLTRDLVKRHSSYSQLAALVASTLRDNIACTVGIASPTKRMLLLRNKLLLRLIRFLHLQTRQNMNGGKMSKRDARLRAWLDAGDAIYDLAKVHAQALIHAQIVKRYGTTTDSERFASIANSACEVCQQY